MQTLIVFSHLRWDFVYQRPQHLMSRLARHYRIFFIEEPDPASEVETVEWQATHPLPQLTVLRPRMPVAKRGFEQGDAEVLLQKLDELRRQHPAHLVWMVTPMALPLLDALEPSLVVYDCMDELSAFLNPPAHLLEHERSLLARADLVFTGGPSLHASKRDLHQNVHCFPSSVDLAHFRKALDRNIAIAAHEALPKPRLGYFGVIDERLDLELIASIADAHPEWQLMMVGPVAKIDESSLPRRANIHYTGQQPYASLPAYLASWDVCLMPFALNESTRYISPTKSLEYMAAELPVVSTAVRDVVDQHSDVVAIAHTHEEFIACCEAALAMSASDRRRQIRQMRIKLSRTSWDATAGQMHRLMLEAACNESSAGAGSNR